MADTNYSLARRPDEKKKFVHLMRTVLWIRERTGKSSGEVIRALLHKSNTDFYRAYYSH
jgi:hypothetical protein